MRGLVFIVEGREEPIEVAWPLEAAVPIPGDMVEIEHEKEQFLSAQVTWRKFERVRTPEGHYYFFRTLIGVEEIK